MRNLKWRSFTAKFTQVAVRLWEVGDRSIAQVAKDLVATLVRMIFAEPDVELTRAQHARVVEQLVARGPAAAESLRDTEADLLAFASFARKHSRQIWSNNPQERLNRKLTRRTDVVGILPNREAIIRLIGAVLAEQHDERAVVRRFLTVNTLPRPTPEIVTLPEPAPTPALKRRDVAKDINPGDASRLVNQLTGHDGDGAHRPAR